MSCNCTHEWLLCTEYDSIIDEADVYLECRKCETRIEADEIKTKIYGSRYISIRYPFLNLDTTYKKPITFNSRWE